MADTAPWILTTLTGAVAALFGLFNKALGRQVDDRDKQLGELKTEKATTKTEFETKLNAAQDTIKSLGEKLDAMRTKLEEERITVAKLMVHARRIPEQPEPYESEMPSQVKALAQVAPTQESRRELDERLRRFVDSSEPPIPKPPPLPQMRPRQKSRPDRDR